MCSVCKWDRGVSMRWASAFFHPSCYPTWFTCVIKDVPRLSKRSHVCNPRLTHMYSILIGETVSYKEAMLNNGRRRAVESSQEYIAVLMGWRPWHFGVLEPMIKLSLSLRFIFAPKYAERTFSSFLLSPFYNVKFFFWIYIYFHISGHCENLTIRKIHYNIILSIM